MRAHLRAVVVSDRAHVLAAKEQLMVIADRVDHGISTLNS
jgi:hypothetical protein